MSIDKKKIKNFIGISAIVLGVAFVGMSILARKKKPSSIYEDNKEQKNPFEGKKVVLIEDENDKENADGVKGHLEVTGDADYNPGFYERRIKRAIDVVLSFFGLVVLSPVFAVIALAIKIEDPGPVLFTQKRVGQNKRYFKLHKFRSMKMSTPHDVPTHQLENPEQYITKVGKFLRKHSLDELPQIWDIFIGNMSVIGPRPGLWNQDLLTAERDKYGANDVKPGLTGWAQINGRDELEIPNKAKLDGEYMSKLGILMDVKCFLGSLHVFGKDGSVIEGGTGRMKKQFIGRHYTDGKSDDELIGNIGFGEPVQVDKDGHKRVLITGAGSYIGESFRAYAAEHYPENFMIEAVDMIDPTWRDMDFSPYDVVYHVAGIAHADVGNVPDEMKEKYYVVNTDLAIEVAEKAKANGVKEFIFMSSMIVYGESAPYGIKKIVDENTVPSPANFYGDSKLQADVGVRELADDRFKVIVLRPPIIYGKGSKGNYPTLAKLAKKLPVFPNVENQRSMLYIENLCEFLCQIMLVRYFRGDAIVLIPQNREWTKTSDIVQKIARVSGRKIHRLGILNLTVIIGNKIPGKIGRLVNKAFGNSCYSHVISDYPGIEYQIISLIDSIKKTETILSNNCISYNPLTAGECENYSVLMSIYKNDEKDYLRLAIESMLKQTVPPEQFVIVEDGPIPLELDNIVLEYTKIYPQLFTVVRLDENGGLGNALNQGLKVCRNELIARMDSDDISKLNRCELELKEYSKYPNMGILGTQIDEFIGDISNIVSQRIVPTEYEDIIRFGRRRSPFNHPTVMYRKSIIDSLGGYTAYGRKEDLDLFIRAINSGVYTRNLKESLLYYRTSRDNLKRRKTWINCKEYILVMYSFYRKDYIGLKDLFYVLFGQTAMFVMPSGITRRLSNIFLRE